VEVLKKSVSSKAEIFVKDRELVLPGQALAKGLLKPDRGVYVDKDGVVRSYMVGLAEIGDERIGVIPLKGSYVPKTGDLVIARIEKMSQRIIFADINAYCKAIMIVPKPDPGRRGRKYSLLAKYEVLAPGDIVLAKIMSYDGVSNPLLSIKGEGLGKLVGGSLIMIEPSKVPRALGKRQSMLQMLKQKAKCDIIIAQNGIVWVNSDDPRVISAIEMALRKIERESHLPGLTERVGQLLDSLLGGNS